MKIKLLITAILAVFLLSACGSKGLDKPLTLLNHNQEEVTFPLQKPTVFFFITSYNWGICQKQLVQLHENLKELEDIEAEMFIISKDTPEHQLELFNALNERYGYSLPFISDPELKLIDHLGMKADDTAYRGYALMDQDGKLIFKTINDHWGEEAKQTAEEIKKELKKLLEKK